MSKLSPTALLLLKLELLSGARRGVLSWVLGGKLISMKTAILLKALMALLYVSLTCLVPLLTLSDFGEITEFGRGLVQYHHLIINGAVMLMFYFGLFVGANVVYELAISENEQLLSCPIVMEDLVHFRVMDVYMAVLLFCLYVICPFTCLMFLALGWSVVWIVAMMILTVVVLIAVYLLGINALLSIAKRLPHRGSDGICITIFLVSAMLFVIVVRSFKAGYYGTGAASLWVWLERQLSQFSFSFMMDNTVSQPWGIGQYALSLAAGAMFVMFLSKVCVRTFGQAFDRIHIQAYDMTSRVKRSVARLSFMKLNRYLMFFPLDIRTLLIKDVLALVRRPRMLVNIFAFVIFLILAANWRHAPVADPVLFVLYLSSTFIVSRLFINIIGQERNNILVIKQLLPSVSRYPSLRARITFGVSLFVLLPFWIVLIGLSSDLTLLGAVWRLPLLLLDVSAASILVTWYSAAFAEFNEDSLKSRGFGVHPMAMLFFWVFSVLLSIFFYRLDLALLTHKVDNMTVVLIALVGVSLVVSTVVFGFLGVRRIKHHA